MKKASTGHLIHLAICVLVPQMAFAYVGPGAGLTAIGTFIALIGAVLLGILGFVWYPVKRLLARNRNSDSEQRSR